MGRCNHEAVAVDPHSGDVFLTEDTGDSCFYRYVARDRHPNRYGDLQKGGKLYAMVIDASASAVCDGSPLPVTGNSVDVRSGVQSFLGQPLKVRWARIEEPDPEQDTLRLEAQAKGAAIIARGEGCWYGDGLIYFISTSGGDAGCGQVWAYDPRRETVTLIVESTSEGELDSPDNITVAPDGTLYLCEDGGGEQFVVGVDDDGDLFKFARNNYNDSEFAGACFSPDGKILFVNMQSFGVTFAIFRDNHRPIALERGRRGQRHWRHKGRDDRRW
jgi:secreted PhoX family phosphatase